jgi:hypothetical protein
VAYLVEVFLPLYGRSGDAISGQEFQRVKDELTDRHGGLTAFTSAPAEGRWRDDKDEVTRDEIVVFEVMVETLDRDWWRDYRLSLEERFDQDEVVVRAQAIERL